MNTSTFPRTAILVNERLPKDLANIVLGYFKSKERDWASIPGTGEYETCLQMPKYYSNLGLYMACWRGHMELVQLMISHGEDDWNHGLHGACRGGHIEIARLMISLGARDLNYSLYIACLGGHREIVQLMISKGATKCDYCPKSIDQH